MTQEQKKAPVVCDATIAAHVANAAHGDRYGIDWIWHHDGIGYLYASQHSPAIREDMGTSVEDGSGAKSSKSMLESLIGRFDASALRGAPLRPDAVAKTLRAVVDAISNEASDGDWRERERLALLQLRNLLEGFEIRMETSPLESPATYLDRVTLTCEFQPGTAGDVAKRITTILSEPARQPPAPAGIALNEAQCIAVYDAVSRSNITRDVKTPEKKVGVVRGALAA